MPAALNIGIVAGESSGDILGAGLMSALKARHPAMRFRGIGGPLMVAQGLEGLAPMEPLSVMGLVEPLKRLPQLFAMRSKLLQDFKACPPDVFIGIDAPDFNLGLEKKLRSRGVAAVHYVSPSVWAWRRWRMGRISRAVDLMLTLFPFEESFYREHGVPVRFVGHPLADEIPFQVDLQQARAELGLAPDQPVLALLPGSRRGEVARLARTFLRTAALCRKRWPAMEFVVPCANEDRHAQLRTLLDGDFKELGVKLALGQSRRVMAAADIILLASGTAALEALLLKKPMVVAYRMAPLSHALVSRLLKVPCVSLPNLLAGKRLVAELIQHEVQEHSLLRELRSLLEDQRQWDAVRGEYEKIHENLRRNANQRAAEAVLELCGLS